MNPKPSATEKIKITLARSDYDTLMAQSDASGVPVAEIVRRALKFEPIPRGGFRRKQKGK